MDLQHRVWPRARISTDIPTMRLTCATCCPLLAPKLRQHFMNSVGVMGLPGKPDGTTGAEVEKYYRDGHIRQIAEYCESDVLNTYRVWLRYELFRGRLSDAQIQASEANLVEFVKAR